MTDPSLPPDNDLLRRFLLGELAGPDLERVAAYLDRHPEVASTLNALAVRDTLLDALRAGDRAPADPPELSALIGRLTHLGAASDPQPTPAPAGAGRRTVTSPAVAGPADVPTADPEVGADVPYDLAGVLAPAEGEDEIGRLGKYRVTYILGRGGMGVVFAAVDTKLKRNVALKVMLPGLAASPPARQRFLREAENAARVEHDNIVPIYDIAEDRGIPFLAMPLLVGETLDARLRSRGPLAPADVLVVGRQVAEGLTAAHAAGLIHRDVKPSNVWLERGPAGAFRRARILDFGLARPARGSGEDQDITHTGVIMGTPAYMAPEQARGADVDHRADLFSLGCVLYQMATGRRPFQGADPFAILTALAVDHPPAPAEVNPHCPPALSALVLGLLAKDPADRWPATAQQVADELARIALDPDATAPAGSVTHLATQPEDVWSEVADSATEADAVPKVGPAEPAAPPRPSPARGRGRGPLWAAVVLLVAALGLVGYLYGTQIVRVVTDKGELVIDVDDPNIEVKVVRVDAVIVDRTTGREFVLKAGDGEVTFHDPHSGAEAVTKTFRITRGGKAVVSASMVELRRKNGGKPGEAKPRADTDEPRLPVAGADPAKNAFPGRPTFYDTFDDPKACVLPLLEAPGVRRRVEDSRYKVILAAGKANEVTPVEIGPGAADGAFAIRVRAEHATWLINFRLRGDGPRGEWLGFVVPPDGRWLLGQFGQKEVNGRWEPFIVRLLAAAPAPVAELGEGRFVAVAGRWVGKQYAVWANGREVVYGTLPEGPEPGAHDSLAIQVCSRQTKDGAARLELAYAATWDLSGPAPAAGRPKPGPKE